MDTETFNERLELTKPFIEAVVNKWVRQLPGPCHTGERPVSVLHGPIPLAPIAGSTRQMDRASRYLSVWAAYEGPERETCWWTATHVWRWRWRALRHARRSGAELLTIRTAVRWAESIGR